ncbi:WD40 repeat-like protein [Dacryopinax primogenitus]|uniref:WD40 repeat-like protein n=1 Tax=Dacryopinax primogenitus (strain DJM 731) TaxID=1858805 RepID=M5G0Z1_DACPD|nr:WD40 repeat-like protein [Dacryopinax primogenitus]EJT97452.1 WD40 repeat-like protein [Dacryopinax primogenitus]
MLQSALLPTSLFQDIITDLSYNYYGTSLAVASADHRVRIFSLSAEPSVSAAPGIGTGAGTAGGSSGGWELEDEFKAHDAPLTRVSFAHPAFGPLLATAAFDRTVKIFEDVPSRGAGQRSRWVERKVFTDQGASIRSLEWAPEALGLKLAGVGADGCVRIWECLDLPSLEVWETREELGMMGLFGEGVVGAGGEGVREGRLGGVGVGGERQAATGGWETDAGWALAWCAERWWGDVLAVCCANQGCVKIMQFPGGPARPVTLTTLVPPTPPTPVPLPAPLPRRKADHSHSPLPLPAAVEEPPRTPLTSVAWAPACGKSFHLLAAGSEAGCVYLWKVVPGKEGVQEEDSWKAELVGEFEEHGGRPVGRVQFNPTGTILSSAGDDGRIRLWKASFTGVWRAMGSVWATPGDEEEEEDEGEDGYES